MFIWIEGLNNSFNPFSFLGFFLFAVFLGRYVYSVFEAVFFGAFFIIGSYYIQYISLMGAFDYFFKLKGVEQWLHFFSLVVAGFFLFKGWKYFVMWNQSKKGSAEGDQFEVPPILLDQGKRKNAFFYFLRVSGYFIFLGGFTAILRGLWAQEYYLLSEYYFLVSDNKIRVGFEMILKYLIGANVLNLCVWFFCVWVVCSEDFKCFLREQSAFRNMLNSAIFLSVGIGLIYGNLVKFNII